LSTLEAFVVTLDADDDCTRLVCAEDTVDAIIDVSVVCTCCSDASISASSVVCFTELSTLLLSSLANVVSEVAASVFTVELVLVLEASVVRELIAVLTLCSDWSMSVRIAVCRTELSAELCIATETDDIALAIVVSWLVTFAMAEMALCTDASICCADDVTLVATV